jgi:hypothetical protein
MMALNELQSYSVFILLFRFAVSIALLASVHATCPVVPPGGCAVCGVGKCISNPDVKVALPGEVVPHSCGLIEHGGIMISSSKNS